MITAIVSAKGGVGKTTISTNLALALHRKGQDTVLVDGDYRNPNVSLHLGDFDPGTGIQDIIQGRSGVMESLFVHKSGMKYIPAKLSMSYLNLKAGALRRVLRESKTNMILDSAPGINDDTTAIIDTADNVLIVTTPEIPSIADAMRSLEVCRRLGKRVYGVIINMNTRHHKIKPSEIEAITGVNVVGVIPHDKRVTKSKRKKELVLEAYPKAPASREITKIADRITGKKNQVSRFARLKRKIR